MQWDGKQMAALAAAADSGSFEQAAAQLRITPSAVSQRIRALEEAAGALLLTTFQIAISSGAVLGGLLIDLQGATMVFVFVSIAALLGASLMASRRGVVPQVEASQG